MQRKLLTLPIIAAMLSGCSTVYVPSFVKVYEPDIQQGNIYEEAQIERLREGMSQARVRAILGTPNLRDIFHAGQRDTYVYYDKRGKGEAFRHTLVIEYDRNGRVAAIQRDGMDLANAPSMNSAELPEEDESVAPSGPESQPGDDRYSPLPDEGGTGMGNPQPTF